MEGLERPLLLTHVPGDSGDLVVLEQDGRVRLVRGGILLEPPMLDITSAVTSGGERGLLGLAFHPGYATNGWVYVSYTDTRGDSILARYTRAAGDTPRLDPASAEVLLRVAQPYANHNGGHLAFGPDGHLYFGLGDGGSAGDPEGNGQDPHALLGSMLRFAIDGQGGLAIPPDNPYVDGEAGAPEVWAKGLRNPWRFSFDRGTGDLYIADVGQNGWEEINYQPANARGGANYGWNVFEGTHRYKLTGQTFSPPTAPVAEYERRGGECAVTGGYVYRGTSIPALQGTYVLGDYCSGIVRGLRFEDGGWRMVPLLDTDLQISSFGEDAEGELYVVDHGGRVMRLVAEA